MATLHLAVDNNSKFLLQSRENGSEEYSLFTLTGTPIPKSENQRIITIEFVKPINYDSTDPSECIEAVANMMEKVHHLSNIYILIEFNRNWADEFTLTGFMAFSLLHWECYKYDLESQIKGPFTWCKLEFKDAGDLISNYKTTKITNENYNFLLAHWKFHIQDGFDPVTNKFIIEYDIVKFGKIPYFLHNDLKSMDA